MEQQNKSSIGSMIGTIIIIAIIILGGLYFWGKRIEESKLKQQLINDNINTPDNGIPENNSENEASIIRSVGVGDDLNVIEKDLNETKLDNLSSELEQSLQ